MNFWTFVIPPFSNTGINEWHPIVVIRENETSYIRHSVTQASTSGSIRQRERDQRCMPPFSNTGINEWHPNLGSLSFVSVLPPFSNTGINEWHHKANNGIYGRFQPPFSNTGINEWHGKVLLQQVSPWYRHSVTQASTSGTNTSSSIHCTR